MENPYSAPESELSPNEPGAKRSLWWKNYFFVITILSFLGMASILMSEGAGLTDYFELFLMTVATIGLYGFVFSKKVMFPKFWLSFLCFYIVTGVFYEDISNVDMRQGMTDGEHYISLAIGYLISLPAYYALYLYSKADRHPWTGTSPSGQ